MKSAFIVKHTFTFRRLFLLAFLAFVLRFRLVLHRHSIVVYRHNMAVTMGMSSFHITHKLFDDQESHNSSQNPKAYNHISVVIMSVAFASMGMRMFMRMPAIFAVRMRRNGVWNQMQKCVSQ